MNFVFKQKLFFNKFLLILFILNVLCTTKSLAVDVTDVVGIYGVKFYDKGPEGYMTYITIHENEDQYIVINISQHMSFLIMLSLIKYEIAPLPIEEFAITFSAANIELSKTYLIEPLVLKENYNYSTINRGIWFYKENSSYYACVMSIGNGMILEGRYPICYKKLF